jgi:hypothetical protein
MLNSQNSSSAMKVIGLITSAAKWLHANYIDQTKIEFRFEESETWKLSSTPVFKSSDKGGRFKFSISTKSKFEIEICALEILFKSPIQLFNPGNDNFFKIVRSNSDRFPFLLKWDGNEKLDQHTWLFFGIDANFPDHLEAHEVEFRVSARRKDVGFGRFLGEGRTQRTIVRRAFQLTFMPVKGLKLKTLEKFVVVQPFLVQQAWFMVPTPGHRAKVRVHEIINDGSTVSRSVDYPPS